MKFKSGFIIFLKNGTVQTTVHSITYRSHEDLQISIETVWDSEYLVKYKNK